MMPFAEMGKMGRSHQGETIKPDLGGGLSQSGILVMDWSLLTALSTRIQIDQCQDMGSKGPGGIVC